MENKLRHFLSFLMILLFAFCKMETGDSASQPSNILTEDQFSEILADYALAESAANLNIKNVSLAAMDTAYAFDPLKFRGIRTTQYDSTLDYYSEHPKLYKAAYDKALIRLTELESRSAAVKKDSVSK